MNLQVPTQNLQCIMNNTTIVFTMKCWKITQQVGDVHVVYPYQNYPLVSYILNMMQLMHKHKIIFSVLLHCPKSQANWYIVEQTNITCHGNRFTIDTVCFAPECNHHNIKISLSYECYWERVIELSHPTLSSVPSLWCSTFQNQNSCNSVATKISLNPQKYFEAVLTYFENDV